MEYVGWYGGGGQTVIVNHGGGVRTMYEHMSGYAVSQGQHVDAGQVVGYVGSTGNSDRPAPAPQRRDQRHLREPARLHQLLTVLRVPQQPQRQRNLKEASASCGGFFFGAWPGSSDVQAGRAARHVQAGQPARRCQGRLPQRVGGTGHSLNCLPPVSQKKRLNLRIWLKYIT